MPAHTVARLRVGLVVALIGALAMVALLSPVSAGPGVTRGFVKKLVTRKVNAVSNVLEQSIRATRMSVSSVQLVGPTPLTGSGADVTVATVSIPDAGNYVVTAKLWWTVVSATSTNLGGEIDCDLAAGGDFDTSRESGVTDFDYGTMSLQLTHAFTAPGTAVLRCRDEFSGGNPVQVHNVVVTAEEFFALGSTRLDRGTPAPPEPVGVRP